MTAKHTHSTFKSHLRAYVASSLLTIWSLAAATGFLLYFAPHGSRSGRIPMLFGSIKHGWGDVHFWVCVVAVAITAIHVAIDWKGLKVCVRHLTSSRRSGGITAKV